ncbi:MAG: hypothetical protein A2X08_16355 [Bacteroidetes bacterium GWA2_32_17]|nr:MAG: hypothetical protein A2X08_16355 [Bacteroidetes bacterium GWA2_32_17]
MDSNANLKMYSIAVENLAFFNSEHIFRNSSRNHAAIVVSTMLKYSKDEFRIYDNNLSGDIADKFYQFYINLNKFVEIGKFIKIVVDDISDFNCEIYKKLKVLHSTHPNKVFLAISDKIFRDNIFKLYKSNLNFAIGDKKSFRLEEINVNKKIEERKAFCCFNNDKYPNQLINIFDNNFGTCKSVF